MECPDKSSASPTELDHNASTDNDNPCLSSTSTPDSLQCVAKRKTSDGRPDTDKGKKIKKNQPAKPAVLELDDIFADTEEGSDRVLSTCLPKMVKLKATPPGHKSAVWSYFSLLYVPICQKLDASIKTSPMKMNFGSAPRYKKFTHLCMLCFEMVKRMADRHNTSWSKLLCTITKTGNATRHLTTSHSTHSCDVCMG